MILPASGQFGSSDGFQLHLGNESDVITSIQRLPDVGLSIEAMNDLKKWGTDIASDAQKQAEDLGLSGEAQSIVTAGYLLQSAESMPNIKSALSRVIVQWAGVMEAAGVKDDSVYKLVTTFTGWLSSNPMDTATAINETADNIKISYHAVEAAAKKAAAAAKGVGDDLWDKLLAILREAGVWTGVGLGMVIVIYAAYKKYGTK